MAPCRIQLTGPDGRQRQLTNVEADGGEEWLSLAADLGQHWTDTSRSSPAARLDDGLAELHILKGGAGVKRLLQGMAALERGAVSSLPLASDVLETQQFT